MFVQAKSTLNGIRQNMAKEKLILKSSELSCDKHTLRWEIIYMCLGYQNSLIHETFTKEVRKQVQSV